MATQKPDKPKEKANELGWALAFLFPKKAKPIPPKPAATLPAGVGNQPPAASTPAPTTPPVLFVPTPPPAASAMPSTPITPPAAAPKGPVTLPPPTAAKGPVVLAPPPAPLPTPKTSVSADAESTPGPFTFQPKKVLPAFWTVSSGLSMLVNIILIVTLIIVGQELFRLKRIVGGHVIGGLNENFVLMDQAHIKTQIQVQDTIPINFTLPISQDTTVTLTEPTYIPNVMIVLNSGGLTINSPANITLPAGTNLPVHLQLDVPVTTMVPITLNVPVDIPLDQTELHTPFVGLKNVIGPFNDMLLPSITTSKEAPPCQNPMTGWFCDAFFVK